MSICISLFRNIDTSAIAFNIAKANKNTNQYKII